MSRGPRVSPQSRRRTRLSVGTVGSFDLTVIVLNTVVAFKNSAAVQLIWGFFAGI